MFLDKLKTFLNYRNLPTDEIVEQLADDPACRALPFLESCRELLRRSVSFPSAWKEAVLRSKDKMALKEEDVAPLLSLAEIVGSSDVDGQLNALSMVAELLQCQREEAMDLKEKKGRLYRSLGALAGAGMVIILF